MKKKLEAELISIAHRILQLKDRSTLPQLQEEARQLYEKLTILSFAEDHFAGPQPTIGQIHKAIEEQAPNTFKEKESIATVPVAPPSEIEKSISEPSSQNTHQEVKEQEPVSLDQKPELVIEEINARVSEDLFVPASDTSEEVKTFSDTLTSTPDYQKNDMNDVTPQLDKSEDREKPKSLNEQLRKDIHIGLNDRLAFIKHLFEGSTPDYNRVLSQLNTINDKKGAEDFISSMVKPDYNNWEGKEEYEDRFMDVVLSKYEN